LKISVLMYLDSYITDEDLSFAELYLPEVLGERLRGMEEVSEVYYALPEGYSGKLDSVSGIFRITEKNESEFLKRFFNETGSDHVIKVYADSPFLDPEVIRGMLDVHISCHPEFTYSENVPPGYCCEIFSRDLVESLPESSEEHLPLSSVIRSNIHHFDVEIYYSDPDVRDTRLSFRSGNPREKVTMERMLEKHGAVPRYAEIRDVIIGNPGVLFNGPSFIEVELTGRCNLDCLFCYRKTLACEHGDMELPVFMSIVEGMRSFRLPYSICLGGSGEPLMHSQFYRVCEAALKEELLSTIVVETNGIYADDNFRSFLSTAAGGVIKVIVNINGYDRETYRALHGDDYFEQVYQNIVKLKEVAEPGSLYVQIMKINETDTFLDRYYDFWEKTGVPIILQKQNVYQGRIQDRRYSDLSPIERTSCWHLQRDMFVLADGRIAFCKQDVDGINARGSLKDTTLPVLFECARNDFLQDYQGSYRTSPDCRSCDEWYTFNL